MINQEDRDESESVIMPCEFVQGEGFTGFMCTPSGFGRNPTMKVKVAAGIGYSDMPLELFEALRPYDKVTVYNDGAGIWGDFQGSWEKTYQKWAIKVLSTKRKNKDEHRNLRYQ